MEVTPSPLLYEGPAWKAYAEAAEAETQLRLDLERAEALTRKLRVAAFAEVGKSEIERLLTIAEARNTTRK